MTKLLILVLIIFTSLGFAIGYSSFAYLNPSSNLIINVKKPIVSDKIEDLEHIEANGEDIADCQTKLNNCWWNFEKQKQEVVEIEKQNYIEQNLLKLANVNLNDDIKRRLEYQNELLNNNIKLEQDLKELTNSLNICYQLK